MFPEGVYGGPILMPTLMDVRRRLKSIDRWLGVLRDGLNGSNHHLGSGEADAFQRTMEMLGIQLLSVNQAKKRSLRLKRGANPIVRRYYPAPISAYHSLYCLEQFSCADRPAANGSNSVPEKAEPLDSGGAIQE